MRADQARQIPIHHFLERAGIKPAKTVRNGCELWYSSPIREGDANPSFKVDTAKNLWFDHGAARGGNVIDLVVEMRRVTVAEALAVNRRGTLTPHRTAMLTPSVRRRCAGQDRSCGARAEQWRVWPAGSVRTCS